MPCPLFPECFLVDLDSFGRGGHTAKFSRDLMSACFPTHTRFALQAQPHNVEKVPGSHRTMISITGCFVSTSCIGCACSVLLGFADRHFLNLKSIWTAMGYGATDVETTACQRSRASVASQALNSFQLPDDWWAEEPKEETSWCQTCCWNGSWADLLHRSNLRLVSRCCPLLDEASLTLSASAGNFCCAILLALYHRYLPSGQSGYVTLNFNDEFLVFDECCRRLPPWGSLKVHSTSPLHLVPNVFPGVPATCAEPYPMVETGSTSNLEWAKARIDTCLNAHTCQEFRSKDRILPTRLIQILRNPVENGVRLRYSSDLRQDVDYVALSHCWGTKTAPCLTTSETLQNHLENIRWSLIPQTFRDAVLFAASLGIEYIWIDSICIVQGDDANAEADWSRESARMFKYYSNAHVTLAATCSSDSSGGLFTNDPIDKFHLLDFTFRGRDYPLFASETPTELLDFTDAASGLGRDIETKYPLLSRAWVFQERLVSPRVIFFTKTQLIWDCYSCCVFMETAAQGPNHSRQLYQGLKQNYLKLLSPPANARTGSISAFEWNHVLKAYSHLKLSDPRDRLPAIAAVAEQILSHKYDDPAAEYLCGLRKENLHTDLLWMPAADRVGGRSCKSRRDAPYVAPSWSWASFPGRIMDTAHYESWGPSTIRLVQDALVFNEARRFSRILGGHITIEGPVVECVWDSFEPDWELPPEGCPRVLRVLPQSTTQGATTAKQLRKEQHTMEFIPDYAASYDEIAGMVDQGQGQVCLLQTWNGTVRQRSGALALYYNKMTGRYTRLGAKLREQIGFSEKTPWGLVDNSVFGSAKRRVLTLE